MSTFKFVQLDPRPQGAEANGRIFAEAPQGVLGIEVSVQALARECILGNIDPQHLGFHPDRAAIEEAREWPLPPDGAVLATIRPDLDSVGSMAIIALRADGETLSLEARERIEAVAREDTFARGAWPGPRSLPSRNNPWPGEGGVSETRDLAAIAAAVADFKVSLEDRVGVMRRWLASGEEPSSYRGQVEVERAEMVRALEAGEIEVERVLDGLVAVVRSSHRAALAVGYSHSPVVIAENPAFRLGGGEPHRKVTVAAYGRGIVDFRYLLAQLTDRELGWGGSDTILGSPQGVSTTLSTEEVVAEVRSAMNYNLILRITEDQVLVLRDSPRISKRSVWLRVEAGPYVFEEGVYLVSLRGDSEGVVFTHTGACPPDFFILDEIMALIEDGWVEVLAGTLDEKEEGD